MIWHSLTIEKIFQELKTNENGLNAEEILRRQKKYGKNKLPERKKTTTLEVFLNQFKNPLIFILIVAAFVTFALQEFIDSAVILTALLINSIVGFFQENKAEKTLLRLKQTVQRHARVIREKKEHLIEVEELVPGDMVIVEAGDIVPADARLLSLHNLQVTEAVLTGESIPSSKKISLSKEGTPLADRENMIYMGTTITRGKAKAVVTATGLKTEIGQIASLIRETEKTKTPLQKKIGNLARLIGLVIVGICLILFVAGLLTGRPFLEMLLISVAVAVAGVPEGLVIALTVCLAIGMQRILEKKALVRRLIAAETLGSITVICSDKTGTLTEGKMSVAGILPFKDEYKEDLFKIALLCNNVIVENYEDELKNWVLSGDTTEIALLLGAVESGLDREKVIKIFPRLDEIPFESEKMYMATLHEMKDENHHLILIKGAPESVFNTCQLTSEQIEKVKLDYCEMAAKGLRVLAFAQKKIKAVDKNLQEADLTEMEYLGLIALKDPLRPETKETIKECLKAGIRPIIVTGDHRLTAQAIGEEIGLIKDKNIIEAKDLDKLSDIELQKEVKRINIFARVEPKHKIRIINALKANKEAVAMTGDGINDAPAIKAADIGIALGSGSEVTKEAADIVLLDDNFKTIVEIVKEGRTIFDNIKKIITYLFCSSFTEVILIAGAIIFRWPLPLLAAQILWVNIISDTLPAMALAYEKGESEVLKEKPRSHDVPIFNKEIGFLVFFIGILTDLILLTLFWFLLKQNYYEIGHLRTIIFVGLGIASLFFVYSCKNLKKNLWHYNPFNNKFLNLSVLFGVAMLLIAVYSPFFQKILRTTPLNLIDWLILISLGLINVILIEFGKSLFIVKK